MLTKPAYAKINLTLDVTSKRADGYHNLGTVMQSVTLCDVIHAEKAEGIILECRDSKIPLDEKNTCHRAAGLFFKRTGILGGVRIVIEKNIPSEAGLGGGSSDAAATLLLLNELYDARLSYYDLEEIAALTGADVPFCIRGGAAVCRGIGEKMTGIGGLEKRHVLLVKPGFGISTPEAYAAFDKKGAESLSGTKKFLSALEGGENPYLYLSNDLEAAIENTDIAKIRMELSELGAEAAQMTGSGSCVFGLFEDLERALRAQTLMRDSYPFCELCETI